MTLFSLKPYFKKLKIKIKLKKKPKNEDSISLTYQSIRVIWNCV